VAALFLSFGAALPAEQAGGLGPLPLAELPVRCFIRDHRNPLGEEIPCQASRRVNSRGHVVYDFVWEDGIRSTLVFWNDEKVESIGIGPTGDMEVMTGYFLPVEGGIDVVLSHGSSLFLKGIDPHRN